DLPARWTVTVFSQYFRSPFSAPTFLPLDVPAPPSSHALSLHDALPIFRAAGGRRARASVRPRLPARRRSGPARAPGDSSRSWERSEEHTSELQSREKLVCRLLLEKK